LWRFFLTARCRHLENFNEKINLPFPWTAPLRRKKRNY
jgi:hypothetical protein